MYIPDDTWNIVKEFMLDWKKTHQQKLKKCLDINFINLDGGEHPIKKGFWKYRPLQGIRSQYPKKCISWNYDRKTKFITSYWRIPWQHDYEIRLETPDQEELSELIEAHRGNEWGTGPPYIGRARQGWLLENDY